MKRRWHSCATVALVILGIAAAAPAQAQTEAPAVRQPATADATIQARWSLAAGPQAVWSGGGVGPLLAGALVLTFRPLARYEFSSRVLLPAAADVTTADGHASVAPRFFTLGMARRWAWREGRLRASFGGDTVLLWTRVDSNDPATGVARSEDHVTVAFIERGTLSARVAGPVAVTADVGSGFAFSRTPIRVADKTVATWGRPLLMAGLRLEVFWP